MNENSTYMVDLDFQRTDARTGLLDYIGTTVYSPEQEQQELDDLRRQGWMLTARTVIL